MNLESYQIPFLDRKKAYSILGLFTFIQKVPMLKLVILLIPILFLFQTSIFSNSYNKQIARLDNEYIQTYKGRDGRWVQPYYLTSSFKTVMKRFGTSEKEVKQINEIPEDGHLPLRGAIFFPFSRDYMKKLFNQGKGRKMIESDVRELIWPIGTSSRYVSITSRLGMHNLGKLAMHKGIDIACKRGTPILAANDGIVEIAGENGNFGLAVLIQHKFNNLKTLYAHASSLVVKKGDFVKKGQIIALVGNTGHSTGHHLHFEVRYRDIVLNPEHYFTPPGQEYDEKVVMHEKLLD